MAYISVDSIAECVLALGRDALLAKSDVKQAYRQIPVHPDDPVLLGIAWRGQYFVDATLPFGLRSAPNLLGCGGRSGVVWCSLPISRTRKKYR